ncbi:hypothetical protein J2T55_001485 [Methylohalomonas lacus]|uniref:Uncharacterized protein n=1 Tax=Methylohalomonas lacus TaxID=398773 RepID=A0AAE3HLR7_9GAMM|nr:hypothetical protein [Methylohalomonas lacus]MCS3903464.1 hypothetical protein [Methylohalomonas lacus]
MMETGMPVQDSKLGRVPMDESAHDKWRARIDKVGRPANKKAAGAAFE